MGREIGLVLSVVPNLKPLSYDQGDIIYMEGDYAEQGIFIIYLKFKRIIIFILYYNLIVFFINFGIVNLKSSNGSSFHTLNNGDVFGEIEVLRKEYRICSAQAHNRCLLFALNRSVFTKMIEDYPKVSEEA